MRNDRRDERATRKVIYLGIGALLFVLCAPAEAQQQSKVPLIGFMSLVGDPSNPGPYVRAFRQRLRELGYNEGKNIKIEYRFVLGRLDHIPALVDELVQLRVNVLVFGPQPAINAAKKSTRTISDRNDKLHRSYCCRACG